MVGYPEHHEFAAWVALCDDPLRAQRAYWHLVLSGDAALPAVRAGRASPKADVRRWCTKALDHLADTVSFPLLLDRLADPDPQVRIEALHALACDRCKHNSCRPDAASALPHAIRLLQEDPDRHVRAGAVELVGRWVHSHPSAADALVQARDHDNASSVRKVAGWYAPGGTIFRKTARRPSRATARQR
jgi:HEAT repeat protein